MNTTSLIALAASLILGGGLGAAAEPDPIQTEIARLQQALEAKPDQTSNWIALGNALMQETRNSCAHEFTKAEAAFQKALTLSPDDPDALVGMAWVENSNHDFDAGRDWAKKALAINPHLHHAHALLADRAVELGDYEAAFEHLQDALDAHTDLSTLARSAHLLWLTGDARKARWLMGEAIKSAGPYPENTAWCRAELALMHLQTGSLLAADQEATKAFQTAPGNPRVLVAMGRVRAAQHRFEDAIDFQLKSLAVRPTHDALADLMDLYVVTKQTEKVEEHFKRVVAFHGSSHAHSHGDHTHHHPEGNAQLAAFLAKHERDLPRALAEAEKAYETSRNIATTDAYAWCLHLSGDSKQASRVLRRISKWNTPDPTLSYHAALIVNGLGDPSRARKLLAEALNANPRFDPILAPKAHALLQEFSTRPDSPPESNP